MGMAAIGVALWKYVMRYSPENPNFFNRDRFVLSNGKPTPTFAQFRTQRLC
jgi:dihydroxyacetone synthase